MGIIEKMRLDGKAIYVTGGASGIGKSVATALAEAGADVAIVEIKEPRAPRKRSQRQQVLRRLRSSAM